MITKLRLAYLKALVDELTELGVEFVNTHEETSKNKLILTPIYPQEEEEDKKEITAA